MSNPKTTAVKACFHRIPTRAGEIWPAKAYALTESSDFRESLVGCLLFAYWEQAHGGLQMARSDPGSGWWRVGADQQKRAYKTIFSARAGLAHLD